MNLKQQIEALWIERNGTGLDACSTCRPPHICQWHSAMIDELLDLYKKFCEEKELKARINELERITEEPRRSADTFHKDVYVTKMSWIDDRIEHLRTQQRNNLNKLGDIL